MQEAQFALFVKYIELLIKNLILKSAIIHMFNRNQLCILNEKLDNEGTCNCNIGPMIQTCIKYQALTNFFFIMINQNKKMLTF